MTLSPISTRLGSFAAAVATTGILLFAAPQVQAANAPFYQVELAQAATVQKAILRGAYFSCEGTSCHAAETGSAPRNVCVSVARSFGEVKSFQAGKRILDATEIAACNANK